MKNRIKKFYDEHTQFCHIFAAIVGVGTASYYSGRVHGRDKHQVIGAVFELPNGDIEADGELILRRRNRRDDTITTLLNRG